MKHPVAATNFVKVGALYLPFSQGPCDNLTAGLSVRNVSMIKV